MLPPVLQVAQNDAMPGNPAGVKRTTVLDDDDAARIQVDAADQFKQAGVFMTMDLQRFWKR
jgi:hypothetical protein